MPTHETRDAVLEVAQELLQTRGYNAFSYRDLAERVRIKAASVHYHFPTKVELARALIARHREHVSSALAEIDARGLDAVAKLDRYAGIFLGTMEAGNRMCLCGMLASDVATLDPEIVRDLRISFDEHEAWLGRVMAEGEASGVLRLDGDATEEARSLLSSLEGAMLVARTYDEPSRFESAARRLVARLRATPTA